MIKLSLTRAKPAKLARIELGKETFDKIGKVASDSIVLNVKSSQQADGNPIRPNAPATRTRKRRYPGTWRGRVAPLIDKEQRFIQTGRAGSWSYVAYHDHVDITPHTHELKRLSRWNQARGYTGWFALSKKARAIIRRIIRTRIKQVIEAAARRRTV